MDITNSQKYKKVGQKIKQMRKKHNLTQEQLCEKIGISKSYLSKIEAENCDKSFSLDVLFSIADTLGEDIKSFFS